MDTVIHELLSHTLNGISFNANIRQNRNEETNTDDLRSFIRPTDTFEHNIQLLELIQSIESERHSYDVKRRRLRIVSDLMEDYQYNIQLFLRCLSLNTRTESAQPQRATRNPIHTANRPVRHPPSRPTGGLTDRQIELATRTLVYDASLNENRCPISLEDFAVGEEIVQIIGCRHYFKCVALREWFNRNTQCPVCRYNVTTHSGRVRGIVPNNYMQGNNAPIDGNIQVPVRAAELGNTHAWTSLLAGLLTSPENGHFTFGQEIVVPLTFDHPEEVD
jgi:hypothetical protein